MTAARRPSRPNEAAGHGGLLCPNGPAKRDHRPLIYFVLGGIAVAAFFTLTRKDHVPAPAMAIAAPRTQLPNIVVPVTPAGSTTSAGRPPQTWEELRASRAAALAARPAPVPVAQAEPEPEAEAPAAERPRREAARREPPRRQPAREPAVEAPAPPVPASQPASPDAADNAAPGRLTISSTPWGQLIVDGRLYGNTPRLGLPIATGQRRIRVARDGFEAFDTTLTVEPGAVIRLTGIRLREQP